MSQVQIQTEYVRCKNPLDKAIELHERFVRDYGHAIQLDQAVRLIKFLNSDELKPEDKSEISNRALEAWEESAIVEQVTYMAVRRTKCEELRPKADLIRDIRTYLMDCLR